MDNFVIKDLGIACLIFWGVIGLCLVWWGCKTEESNYRDDGQEGAEISPSELSEEEEVYGHQNGTALDVPKQPTVQ